MSVLEHAVTAVRLGPAAAAGCRRRVHLDHDPDALLTAQPPTDLAGRLIRAQIAEHRAAVLAAVGQEGALKGRSLTSDHHTAVVDLLVPEGGGYRPVLVKGHRTLDPGAGALLAPVADPTARTTSDEFRARARTDDMLALAHCQRLLQALGLAVDGPALGGVVGRGDPVDGMICWLELSDALLADYDARFADRVRVAEAAVSRAQPLALPSRVSECRRCPWDARCTVEMTVVRDVSLIAPGSDADALRAVGVATVDQLAAATEEQLAAVAVARFSGAVRGPELRDRARAWVHGAPLVRRRDAVSVPRADIELDVDMECYLEDGAYLWGTFLSGTEEGLRAAVDAGFEPGYQPFGTWSALPSADEGMAFADFWGYLRELQRVANETGLTLRAYCYSRQAEERWLFSTPTRYPEVVGMPSLGEVRAFTASGSWVDMYEMLGREFVAAGSKRLKAVAPVAGFAWRDPEPDGANSMLWYERAVGIGGSQADPASRTRLLQYNEDDVLATRALRTWMTDRAAAQTPTVADLAS